VFYEALKALSAHLFEVRSTIPAFAPLVANLVFLFCCIKRDICEAWWSAAVPIAVRIGTLPIATVVFVQMTAPCPTNRGLRPAMAPPVGDHRHETWGEMMDV
jgi:hypothetical protein